MQSLLERAKALEPELISWRRIIHQNPELGFDLPETTRFVADRLREFGYEPRRVGSAGLTATAGKPGRTILLRADMDALPITEETGLPFASTNGRMHACGHDMHTAALLGAAKLLAQTADELPGTVKLMFQPCEEGMRGAKDMIDNGLLDDPKPDAALALHVSRSELGGVGVCPGFASASCDIFRIVLGGTGSHGAKPHLGVDPINAAAHLVSALQALNSREVDPNQMFVLTIGSIHAGSAHNILPEACELTGTIRTADNEVRRFARSRLEEISRAVASVFRARCDVSFPDGIPPVVNDTQLTQDFSRDIGELLGRDKLRPCGPSAGSEDFSLLGEHCPSVLLWFGTGSPEEGFPHDIHHPKAVFSEDALYQMSAIYAHCALRWLERGA